MKLDQNVLAPLLKSPYLHLYFEQIGQFLEEEKKKRNQFYQWVTPKDKAEFIDGQIVMHSPVRSEHNVIAGLIYQLVNVYSIVNQLGYVGFDKVMIHLTRNSFEPDISFFSYEKSQHFTPEQLLFPAPDFVVEILSKSTEKIDRGIKMTDYALHGIAEYWLVNTQKRQIERYLLGSDSKYFLTRIYSVSDYIPCNAIAEFVVPVISIFDPNENVKALTTFMTGGKYEMIED